MPRRSWWPASRDLRPSLSSPPPSPSRAGGITSMSSGRAIGWTCSRGTVTRRPRGFGSAFGGKMRLRSGTGRMSCASADPAHAAGLAALFGRDALTSAPLDIVHPDLFVRVAQDRTRQAAYAERLERELRYARRDIRNTESNLQSTENNLKKTRDELWRIKNSRTYRFAQRLSSARARAGKILQRLRPGDQKV